MVIMLIGNKRSVSCIAGHADVHFNSVVCTMCMPLFPMWMGVCVHSHEHNSFDTFGGYMFLCDYFN